MVPRRPPHAPFVGCAHVRLLRPMRGGVRCIDRRRVRRHQTGRARRGRDRNDAALCAQGGGVVTVLLQKIILRVRVLRICIH